MPPIPSNLDGLIGLSRRHGVDIKPTLLRVLTDLYIQKPTHSADEERQYTTLALRLLDVVDAGTRAIVMEKLAAYEGAPVAVLRRLFGDVQSQTRAQTPARPRPHEAVPAAAVVPLRNAAGDCAPAGAPVELPASFFAADPAERRLILARLDDAGAAAIGWISQDEATAAVRRLEETALGGRPGDFIRELERTLRIPRDIAQRIVNDPTGEPVVVAARALGMPLAVLQRILMFVNPAVGHSIRRVYELTALFDEIGVPAARRLVALWRDPAPAASRPAQPSQGRSARRVRETATARERPAPIDLDEDLFADRPQRAG